MLKKYFSIALLTLFFATIAMEADAQRRSRTSRDSDRNTRSSRSRDTDTETIGFKDRLFGDIMIGNIFFNGGLSISAKPGIGYKFTERLAAGLGARLFSLNQVGRDNDYFIYGPAIFGRFKIAEQFYLQAEYDNNTYSGPNSDNVTLGTPLIGGGYVSGYGPWKIGIQLLYVIDSDVQFIENRFIDYWIQATYNF